MRSDPLVKTVYTEASSAKATPQAGHGENCPRPHQLVPKPTCLLPQVKHTQLPLKVPPVPSPVHAPNSASHPSNTPLNPPSGAQTPPPSYPGNGVPAAAMQTTRIVHGIGLGSSIDPPFNCHYGYSIHIGVDVHISQNCLVIDDCQITIGSHTWIGPGLTIVTSLPTERRGEQSSYQGRPVIIEDQCWIAPNVTIMPGVRIGKGATVGAGQVVTTSMPAQIS